MEGGTDTSIQNFLWAPLPSVCKCRTFLLVGQTLWAWNFSFGGPNLVGLDQQICALQLFYLMVCKGIGNRLGRPEPDRTGPEPAVPMGIGPVPVGDRLFSNIPAKLAGYSLSE